MQSSFINCMGIFGMPVSLCWLFVFPLNVSHASSESNASSESRNTLGIDFCSHLEYSFPVWRKEFSYGYGLESSVAPLWELPYGKISGASIQVQCNTFLSSYNMMFSCFLFVQHGICLSQLSASLLHTGYFSWYILFRSIVQLNMCQKHTKSTCTLWPT